ncbi:unnamed protein product, partial [Mesorhabditis belari]|uniref:RING-type domain-containing protein n=1 Tax=Mesorhabditis belari TaxID=2138241 RepID=A0AAF3EHG2_9BILA
MPSKIFRSLNCTKCKKPFTPTTDEPTSPQIDECGNAICKKCFDKTYANGILVNSPNQTTAYFLIELLSNDSLVLTIDRKGYKLVKDWKQPECVVCHEEFSPSIDSHFPCILSCRHVICIECSEIIRKEKKSVAQLACPICAQMSAYPEKGTMTKKNVYLEFLNELPQMIEEFEFSKLGLKKCIQCEESTTIDKMYGCVTCDNGSNEHIRAAGFSRRISNYLIEKVSDFTRGPNRANIFKRIISPRRGPITEYHVCGTCMFRGHRHHLIRELTVIEAVKMKDELGKAVTNCLHTYSKGLFPGLSEQISERIAEFEEKMLIKMKMMEEIENFEEIQRFHREFSQLMTRYEEICESFVPHLRGFEMKIMSLLAEVETS